MLAPTVNDVTRTARCTGSAPPGNATMRLYKRSSQDRWRRLGSAARRRKSRRLKASKRRDRECGVIELDRVIAHLVGRAEDRYEIGGNRHEQGGVPGLSHHRAGRNEEKAEHDRKAEKAVHMRKTAKKGRCG